MKLVVFKWGIGMHKASDFVEYQAHCSRTETDRANAANEATIRELITSLKDRLWCLDEARPIRTLKDYSP